MKDEFLRVSAVKKNYLSGTMSLRWWYRQIEEGNLPHFRAGGSVLIKVADVEKFVAELYRDKPPEPPDEPVVVAPVPARSGCSRKGGLRFFN